MNPVEAEEVDHVEEVVKEMLANLRAAGETPERAKARTAAYAQAREAHPNVYAACREVWDGDRLVDPLVLATAATWGELKTRVRDWPPEQRAGVQIRYLGPITRFFLPVAG